MKYKGKYKKCRTCVHAIEPLMVMVIVKESCPKAIKFSSGPMVEKMTCENCEKWEDKPQPIFCEEPSESIYTGREL